MKSQSDHLFTRVRGGIKEAAEEDAKGAAHSRSDPEHHFGRQNTARSCLDGVVACAQNDQLMFFLGEPGGAFRTFSRDVLTGWSGLAIADLRGNRRNEVLVSNYARGTITILAADK